MGELDPREGFQGTVTLVDGYIGPQGQWVRCIAGHVKILPADVTGMPPSRGDTPWCAQVEGELDTVWIPGCKVAFVSKTESPQGDVWQVP